MTDLQTRLADALAYEDLAIRSGGFAIPLPGRGERGRHERPFWSKGWKGCHLNCGHRVDDWDMEMVERITVQDGVITMGRYCK